MYLISSVEFLYQNQLREAQIKRSDELKCILSQVLPPHPNPVWLILMIFYYLITLNNMWSHFLTVFISFFLITYTFLSPSEHAPQPGLPHRLSGCKPHRLSTWSRRHVNCVMAAETQTCSGWKLCKARVTLEESWMKKWNTLWKLLLEFLPVTSLSDEVITVSVTDSLVYLSDGLTLN